MRINSGLVYSNIVDRKTENSNFFFTLLILYKTINPVKIMQSANFVMNGITKIFAEERIKIADDIKAMSKLAFITLRKINNIIAGKTRRRLLFRKYNSILLFVKKERNLNQT